MIDPDRCDEQKCAQLIRDAKAFIGPHPEVSWFIANAECHSKREYEVAKQSLEREGIDVSKFIFALSVQVTGRPV